MTKSFPEISGNLGFGCLRIPMVDGEIEFDKTCELFDAFLASGNNYFDTSTIYLGGKSEESVKRCLAQRHARDEFKLGHKMTGRLFETLDDVKRAFEKQLEDCGVDFFDFYLMHGMNAQEYRKYSEVGLFDWVQDMKSQGLVRRAGFSFHDSVELLDTMLDDHPETEFVQIQFNYLDYDDDCIQSRLCLESCRAHGKPVFVMEPNKGGILTGELPEEATAILDAAAERENATRGQLSMLFCRNFPEIELVLSGMGSTEQIAENAAAWTRAETMSQETVDDLLRVRSVMEASGRIQCTQCHYCDGCPMSIGIPRLIAILNACRTVAGGAQKCYYRTVVSDGGKAGDCIGCEQCVERCPQSLPIPEFMKELAALYE